MVISINGYSQTPTNDLKLENDLYRIIVDPVNGSLSSFYIKENNSDLVSEKRLQANFRICLQSENNLSNYINGMEQKPASVQKTNNEIKVVFSGMKSSKGNYPVDLTYTIKLKADYVSFEANLTNNDKDSISEFWFPRIGGLQKFGDNREAGLAVPGYTSDCRHNIKLFKDFPGQRVLGAEAAEWSKDYPGMGMPWWDLYDEKANSGLYLGYNDTTCRYSTWHMYLFPGLSGSADSWLTNEQAAGEPVGIIFSHVRYPFIASGETFNTGEFIVRAHKGDWHTGSQFYRDWFMKHFPFDKSDSWLRKKSAWFSSIIYQPEDRIITDFKGYNEWTKDAKKYGISTYELIGWNNGGLERNYPMYVPEEKLGGSKGFKELLKSIKQRGDYCLVFGNYNILDQNTDWYKKDLYKYQAQDQFGTQGIWMGWGESTLLARKSLSVRYHIRSSVVPGIRKILDDQFIQLVKDGAQGFQIDKLVVGSSLDFNPLNTSKPDVALCEGLVRAIDTLYKKCRAINPDFRMASEFLLDRMIPYFDVGYRNSAGYEVSPMHYVFPEWTSCQHIFNVRDIRAINGAVLTGSVLVVEPESYQGTLDQPLYRYQAQYIREVELIRNELKDYIFLGRYNDNLGARVSALNEKQSGQLYYKVWVHKSTGKRALIVANDGAEPIAFNWKLEPGNITGALLYLPFEKKTTTKQNQSLTIKGEGLMILIEK